MARDADDATAAGKHPRIAPVPAPTASGNPDRRARILELEQELATLRREDRDEQDAHLLRVMAASVGDYAFTAAELVAHARMDAALRDVLGPCVTPRQVGKRLSRLTGNLQALNVSLHCIGRDEDGCIWQLTESC